MSTPAAPSSERLAVICSDKGRLDVCQEPQALHCYSEYSAKHTCKREPHYRPGSGPNHREIFCSRHGRLPWPPRLHWACLSPELDR